MKQKKFLVIFLLYHMIFCFISSSIKTNFFSNKKSDDWCWTKFTEGIVLKKFGGSNWGYCKVVTHIIKKVYYDVYVSTSSLPNSGSCSKIYIILKGELGISSDIILSKNGFKPGVFTKMQILSEDVGSLKSISIKIADKGSYRCNTIRIEKDQNYWNFECNSLIECPKCKVEIPVSNLVTYDFKIKTRNAIDSGTLENIYVQMFGEKGKTPLKLLTDKGFAQGSENNVTIDSAYVGKIKGISLSINGIDNWKPESIIIRYLYGNGFQENIFVFPDTAILNDPNKPLFISNKSLEKIRNDEKEIFNDNFTDCSDNLLSNDAFGPQFVTQQVNYKVFVGKCPHNCFLANLRTYGLGIHPEEAPICISAIVDRGVSLYGGYFSVSIVNGLDSYKGFPVLSYGYSKRSYTISKLRNIDLIDSDVRILDQFGNPSSRGRLEIRNNGNWGTICAFGLDRTAANIICIQQGYKKGMFLNPIPKKGRKFCNNFEGMNFCGAPQSEILFYNLKCQGNEKNIMDCYREVADLSVCNHDYDTLIECANATAEESIYYQEGTVQLLDNKDTHPENGLGLLKIYINGNWGTVCNKGFTDISATIACKQMGFMSGNLLKDSEDNIVNCQNVNGDNLCGDILTSIIMTSVRCNDNSEIKRLIDCRYVKINSECTHFNDVILKCQGFGDTSGRSQNLMPQKVLNPVYKPLPMLPIFTAKCESNAYEMNFRGDPGSIFLINCPSGCADLTNSHVIGLGIYGLSSSICRAAIHVGVLTDSNVEENTFILTKTYGQQIYKDMIIRGVSSISSHSLKSSFVISKSFPIHKFLSNTFSSFIEKKISINKKNFSFIESEIYNLKPMFDWKSPSNFIFDSKKNSYMDFKNNITISQLVFQTKFTIITKIKLKRFVNKIQTIFSVGGCNGYSLVINKQTELIVDAFCGKNIYNSGIYVPINHPLKLAFSFDSIKIIFYLNDLKYRETEANLKITYQRFIFSIGSSSESNIDIFNGIIEYVTFYNQVLNENFFKNSEINKVINKRINYRNLPKFTSQTIDLRSCISKCLTAPIPGTHGSPEEPSDASKNASSIKESSIKNEDYDEKEVIQDTGKIITIQCNDLAKEIFLKSNSDKVRIKCRQNCLKFDGNVYGNIIYTDNSSICKSAIHAGIIKDSIGGVLTIKKSKSLDLYLGVLKNKIKSISVKKAQFSFQFEEVSYITNILCETTLLDLDFASGKGIKFHVKCPKKCNLSPVNIYGTKIYSSDSSICKSAIHSGELSENSKRGEVIIIILKGKKFYNGSTNFGIVSLNKEETNYSIQFIKSKHGLYIKYKELFKKGSLKDNWNVIDFEETEDGPSNWDIVKSNLPTKSKYYIRQTSGIKLIKNDIDFGSFLIYKHSDFVNTLLRVTFYFNILKPIGIILKYVNHDNFYALVLNSWVPYSMIFIKKNNGKRTVLATSKIELKLNTFYSFTINMYMAKPQIIKVFLQIKGKNINHLLFEIKDSSITQGGIGFGTNGNSDFIISSLIIDNFRSENIKNGIFIEKRTFEQILAENTEGMREIYCKSFYGQSKEMYICKEIHNYCQLRCNEYINKRENILNYNCIKSCIKDSKSKTKIKNTKIIQSEKEKSLEMQKNKWIPKISEKCDFKPDEGNSTGEWVPCVISKVMISENDNVFLEIKYTFDKLKDKKKTLIYPSPLITHCGQMLIMRNDCE